MNFGKFFEFVYYTSEMCTEFGMLKDVNISNQYERQKEKKHFLVEYILQYGTFFNNLTSYSQLFTIVTWLISAPNINQSTFGNVLDGIIWTPVLKIKFVLATEWLKGLVYTIRSEEPGGGAGGPIRQFCIYVSISVHDLCGSKKYENIT